MISYEKALDIVRQRAKIKAHVRKEQAQLRPLLSSLGHVLSDAIHSPEAVPPFDNSAMDGFALRASDTQLANFENPATFKVGACLAAGDPPQRFDHEAALEIMTGAAMPLGGFDAVLRVEDAVRIEQDASILVQRPVQTGDNIRRRGSDFQVKQKLAEAGEKVSSELIMACASLGVDVLPTHAPIRIALLITGRELSRYSDKALEPGMIRDASGPFLLSALQTADLEIVAHKMLPDDPELFQSEVLRILELQPDIILSTGAVSMGRHDFIKTGLQELGARLHFHKVAMRPGKPLLFAEWDNGPVWFGLPGNPVSTIVGWRFFVDPYLRALCGRGEEQPDPAILQNSIKKPSEMICFYKAYRQNHASQLQLTLLDGQASYMISPLLKANCWAILMPGSSEVKEGDLVVTLPLKAKD